MCIVPLIMLNRRYLFAQLRSSLSLRTCNMALSSPPLPRAIQRTIRGRTWISCACRQLRSPSVVWQGGTGDDADASSHAPRHLPWPRERGLFEWTSTASGAARTSHHQRLPREWRAARWPPSVLDAASNRSNGNSESFRNSIEQIKTESHACLLWAAHPSHRRRPCAPPIRSPCSPHHAQRRGRLLEARERGACHAGLSVRRAPGLVGPPSAAAGAGIQRPVKLQGLGEHCVRGSRR